MQYTSLNTLFLCIFVADKGNFIIYIKINKCTTQPATAVASTDSIRNFATHLWQSENLRNLSVEM